MKLKTIDDYIATSEIVRRGANRFETEYHWKAMPHGLAIVRVPMDMWETFNYQDDFPYPMNVIDKNFYSVELIVVRADHPLALLAIGWYWKCRFFEFIDSWLLWQANRLGLAATPRGAYMRWRDLKVWQALKRWSNRHDIQR